MSETQERELTKTRSCGEDLSDRVGSRLQNFSGFKPASDQTPISKSYGWLSAFLQRVNEQVEQYHTHFKSHDISAGRRFRLLDAIKKKSEMGHQIGSSHHDYFENIRTPWGVLGDLIFLDWVDEEPLAIKEENTSRVISGWGNSSAKNQFTPAHVVASPWLNTPFTPARVASKKTSKRQFAENATKRDQKLSAKREKASFVERSILRGLMADQYDQTASFMDLPFSVQRNIQQEMKNEYKDEYTNKKLSMFHNASHVLDQSNQSSRRNESRRNESRRKNASMIRNERSVSSPLRRSQQARNMTSFSSTQYAKKYHDPSSYASKRMLDMMVHANTSEAKISETKENTGLNPILRNSPVISYALNGVAAHNSRTDVSNHRKSAKKQPKSVHSGVSRIHSISDANVKSSVQGLSRQSQEHRNMKELFHSIHRYNTTNKKEYVPSSFHSLMRSIDPELEVGNLADIISNIAISQEKINNQTLGMEALDSQSNQSNVVSEKQRFTRKHRKHNKDSQKRVLSVANKTISDMKSVDYASHRSGVWTGNQERSLLPTNSFLQAFDDQNFESKESISKAEQFLAGLLSSEENHISEVGNSKALENIHNASLRNSNQVGQNLSVKQRGGKNGKMPTNSLFYAAPELNSVVDYQGQSNSDEIENAVATPSSGKIGENHIRTVNGWGNVGEKPSAWLSKDTPRARVFRSSKSSPVVEASSRQVVNIVEKILTKSLPIATTHSARKVLGGSLEQDLKGSVKDNLMQTIQTQVSRELQKSLISNGGNFNIHELNTGVVSKNIASMVEKAVVTSQKKNQKNQNDQESSLVAVVQQSQVQRSIEKGIVQEVEASVSRYTSAIQNELQLEIQKELQGNANKPLNEKQIQHVVERVQNRVGAKFGADIAQRVVQNQSGALRSVLEKQVSKDIQNIDISSSDLGGFAEQVITSMGIEQVTRRSMLSATQKALTTQLRPSRNNKTRLSIPSSSNVVGQRGIKELQTYLNDTDLHLKLSSSVERNFEKRFSEITGRSLRSLGNGSIEASMSVSELEHVRSSLDTFAKDLFDRGNQFESLSKRIDGSIRNRDQKQSNPFSSGRNALLDDAFHMLISNNISDSHAEELLKGVASVVEKNRVSPWFTKDIASYEGEENLSELRQLNSIISKLKNKSAKNTTRSLERAGAREDRVSAIERQRDAVLNDEGYNQRFSRKQRSIRHDSGIFVDAKYMEQSPESFEQTQKDSSNSGKLPFAMTLEAMQYKSNNASLPSWAKRASEKPQIKGTSDMVQSLVHASSAEEVVDVLFDRGNSISMNLPSSASRVIDGIRKEAHKLEQQLSEPTLVAQSRISDNDSSQRRGTRSSAKVIQGFKGLTPFSEGQTAEQAANDSKLQKLTKQLEDLILIAEHQGRDAARQGVRMSVDAPEEEGSRGDTPGELNRDEQVDLEALINHVYYEITERLRQEEDLFNFDNDSFKRGGY